MLRSLTHPRYARTLLGVFVCLRVLIAFFCMCVLCRFTSVFVCLLISESVMAGVNVRCVFLCLSILSFEKRALTELHQDGLASKPGICLFSLPAFSAGIVVVTWYTQLLHECWRYRLRFFGLCSKYLTN